GTLGTAVMIKDDYQELFDGWIEVDGAHDLPLVYSGGIRLFDSIGNQQIAAGNSVEFWQEILDSIAIMNPNPAQALPEHTLFLNQKGFEAETELNNADILESGDLSNLGQLLANTLYFNNLLTSFWSGRLTNIYLSEAGLEEYSATSQLNRITTPTLLLWGRYDFVVSPELGYSAYEEISAEDKELIIFERSGHSPMSNEPDAFVAAVVSFIERNN
ncbi:MAG TPA: hypothetical protein DCE41_32330, partial [Cytophagales bacterium]|nr:hypothetical protein [Cytophagales bacterium]